MGEILNKTTTMKSLPVSERPYEKCIRYGASSLTDTELLAVLLRSGTKEMNVLDLSRTLLLGNDQESGLSNLSRQTMRDLIQIKGVGKVKAVQILCLSELSKRMSKVSSFERPLFDHPGSIADYYMEEMCHYTQEHLKLLILNTKNKLIHESLISKGLVNASLVQPREVFIEAMKWEGVNLILIHNHPSGDPTPSSDDLIITRNIKDIGELIGIHLIDHIIIGDHCYQSLRMIKIL